MEQDRARFIQAWEQIIGYPYVWGAESPERGFDCSGAVRHCWIVAGNHMAEDRTARQMCMEFWRDCYKSYYDAEPGDLCFYGPSPRQVNHVMVVFRKWSNGRLVLAGARGGGPGTINEDAAYEKWALVDICSDTYWRRNLQFTVNPFLKQDREDANEFEIELAEDSFKHAVEAVHAGAVADGSRVAVEPKRLSFLDRWWPFKKRRTYG